MRLPASASPSRRGYSLFEMVGTLAIIALLASVLVPYIIQLIEDAKIVAEVRSIQAMRAATETYFQQHGKFAGSNGGSVPSWTYYAYEGWDRNVLLANGFAETAMRSKLATNAYVRLVQVTTTSAASDILSSRGQIGSVPGFNSNNGYYNFSIEYSMLGEEDGELLYAGASGHLRGATRLVEGAVGFALWRAAGAMASSGGAGRSPGFWATPPRPGGGVDRAWTGLRTRLGDRERLECCYPVPPSLPEPPGGIGGEDGGDRYDNPDAETEIIAPDSSNPVIVVEVVLWGVTVQNAYRLSLAIDGPTQSNWAYFDSLGRVKYDMYDSRGGTSAGIVFVYLAHK